MSNKLYNLGDIANVDISGVDKKIKDTEKIVKLCNFIDVYYNWAISEETSKCFMEASANQNEIDKFSIKKGQVAITKDSETRDDIGIATYISANLENTLLGYHCVLITPYKDILSGKYLNAFLHTSYSQKHFSNNASGSGQRYTLTADAINSLRIPLPSFDKQEKIGGFFSTIDRKIENNNKINNELESMAKTIYDYWFLQFEFPNEEGKPYKSSGGKMVWNEELKREIPEGWEVEKIGNISDLYQPQTISEKDFIKNGKFYVYGANGIVGKYDKYNHEFNEIAICCRGASCGNFIMTQPKSWITGNSMIVKPKNTFPNKEFIYYSLSIDIIKLFITGSAQPQITRNNIENMKLLIPTKKILENFERIAIGIRCEIENIFKQNQELTSLRDFLLPLLMNGQVGFKEVSLAEVE